MSAIVDLQQKIKDSEAIISELKKELEVAMRGERMQAIAAAKELIKAHDLSAADFGFSSKGVAKRAATGDKRNQVAPKYQDPDSGSTWTGRGKSPKWLSAYLAAGRDKTEFLIQN